MTYDHTVAEIRSFLSSGAYAFKDGLDVGVSVGVEYRGVYIGVFECRRNQ